MHLFLGLELAYEHQWFHHHLNHDSLPRQIHPQSYDLVLHCHQILVHALNSVTNQIEIIHCDGIVNKKVDERG